MTQVNATDNSAAYTAQDRWLKMPMAEYIAGYRDFGMVRGYCRECGRYGNCWACPPYDFDETALLEQYTTISLLATVITPSEGVALTPETADLIIRRERQRLDRMLVKMECDASVPAHTARAFFAGTCLLCPPEHCTRRDSLPCRHPESIRPSLEALGLDVARTTSGLFGIDLQCQRPRLQQTTTYPRLRPHFCCSQSHFRRFIFHFSALFSIFASENLRKWQQKLSNSSSRPTASTRPRPASSYSRNSRLRGVPPDILHRGRQDTRSRPAGRLSYRDHQLHRQGSLPRVFQTQAHSLSAQTQLPQIRLSPNHTVTRRSSAIIIAAATA